MALWLIFLLVVVLTDTCQGIQEYCSMNTYMTNATHMQFTKEPSVQEFAIEGKFKALHCCAKGYRSIEWYKDGRPYPWSLGVSQLILYPESANQTVYTQAVTIRDAGNYTCILKNDSSSQYHTIQLKVFENIPDDPKITYISSDIRVSLANSLRLFCEAFAGRVDLPDAHNEAVWRKVGHNHSLDQDPRVRQEKISREDNQTFGTYLIIEDVKREDFGDYVCIISKPGKTIQQIVTVQEKIKVEYLPPEPIPVTKLILVTSAILFFIFACTILNAHYGSYLRVHFKDAFSPLEDDDGKSNDVLVLYSLKDSDLALGVLLSTLQNKLGYKCVSREFPGSVNHWFGELQGDAVKCRRILALLSPAVLNDAWDATGISQAIKQLLGLGSSLILVTLKELPKCKNEVKDSQGETFKSLLRSVNVIAWERSKDDRFWWALRLRLPPKRKIEKATESVGENSSRLTSDSEESFENFV